MGKQKKVNDKGKAKVKKDDTTLEYTGRWRAGR